MVIGSPCKTERERTDPDQTLDWIITARGGVTRRGWAAVIGLSVCLSYLEDPGEAQPREEVGPVGWLRGV